MHDILAAQRRLRSSYTLQSSNNSDLASTCVILLNPYVVSAVFSCMLDAGLWCETMRDNALLPSCVSEALDISVRLILKSLKCSLEIA